MHIWYSHLNESYLLKQQVHYQDAIDLNMKDHQLSQNDQIIVESQYLPRCIHATLENKTMHIEIEKQMSLKIIGDTTILVESKTNDEELEMKINRFHNIERCFFLCYNNQRIRMRCKNETKIQSNDDAIFRYQGTK